MEGAAAQSAIARTRPPNATQLNRFRCWNECLRDPAFRSGTSGRKAGKGTVLLRAALGQRPIVGPVRHSRLHTVPLPGSLRDERSYAGTDGQQAASPKGERQRLGRA